MNKRIVSLVLSLVLIVSSVVSVTAAIDTTGLTSVGVPMSAEYYTGDIASISGSVFTCDSFLPLLTSTVKQPQQEQRVENVISFPV